MPPTPPAPPQFSIRLPDGRVFGPVDRAGIEQWAREGRIKPDTIIIPADGSPEFRADADEILRRHVLAPPTVANFVTPPVPNDGGVSTIIPYRNAPALIGYYTGVFSLIPIVGLAAGPAAIILGRIGLKRRKENPTAKGAAHAWVAIILGTLTSLGNWGVIIVPIVMRLMK